MRKRSIFVALVLAGYVATTAMADVNFFAEPTDLVPGVPTKVNIFIETNEGFSFGIGLIALDMSGTDDALKLSDYEWLAGLGELPDYFATTDLPFPETAFNGDAGKGIFVGDGQSLAFGSVIITANGKQEDSFILSLNPFVGDDNFGFVDVKEGSEIKFNLVPEPATALLLACGLLGLTRRRA